MEGSNAEASSPAELLSDSILRLVESIESVDPGELSQQLLGDDESLRTVVEALPRFINAAVRVCNGLAEGLERLGEDSTAELMAGSISQVDGAAIGEAINSLSRVIIRSYESDPELFNKVKMEITTDTVNAIDFGKLRKYLTYQARRRSEYSREALALMGEEPVALINLVSLLPEYVNNTLVVLNQLLDILTFPSEAMTYAVFKILEEIHWEELSEALNGTFKFIDALQRGNLLIGDGSSEFEGVITSVSEDLVRNLDFKWASRAFSALSDNLEPVVTSLATAALQTEDGALAVGGALLSLSNLSIRSTAVILDRASALPPEVTRKMAGGLRQSFSARELGAAINSALVLFNRFTEEDPEMLGAILDGVLSGVDPAQAGLAGKTLVTGFSQTLLAGPAAGEPLLPGVLATVMNNALASFNQLSGEDPQLISRRLDRFLTDLDEEQLGQAARNATSQVTDAALRNPGVARVVVKAIASATYNFIKGYMKNLWSKR